MGNQENSLKPISVNCLLCCHYSITICSRIGDKRLSWNSKLIKLKWTYYAFTTPLLKAPIQHSPYFLSWFTQYTNTQPSLGMEKFALPAQQSRCVLAGGKDRPPQRLCLTFFWVSSYYSCISTDSPVIPGKTAGHVFLRTIKANFLVISTEAEAISKPSSWSFVVLSHLRGREKYRLSLN